MSALSGIRSILLRDDSHRAVATDNAAEGQAGGRERGRAGSRGYFGTSVAVRGEVGLVNAPAGADYRVAFYEHARLATLHPGDDTARARARARLFRLVSASVRVLARLSRVYERRKWLIILGIVV